MNFFKDFLKTATFSSFSRSFRFFFFFHIFIHCHPLLSYGPNFNSLAHREVSSFFFFFFVFFIFLSSFSVFCFLFPIFIHCHSLLSYGPNLKPLAHQEVSLRFITKFRPDRHTRKRVNKNMVIIK